MGVSRLARKAESARQARLRHKQFVTDLQEQAAGLNARIRQLEAHCTTGAGSPPAGGSPMCLPARAIARAQRNGLPYSSAFLEHVNNALSMSASEYPELEKPMQQRVGCLMYAATSTRPDIAYAVHQLCR